MSPQIGESIESDPPKEDHSLRSGAWATAAVSVFFFGLVPSGGVGQGRVVWYVVALMAIGYSAYTLAAPESYRPTKGQIFSIGLTTCMTGGLVVALLRILFGLVKTLAG